MYVSIGGGSGSQAPKDKRRRRPAAGAAAAGLRARAARGAVLHEPLLPEGAGKCKNKRQPSPRVRTNFVAGPLIAVSDSAATAQVLPEPPAAPPRPRPMGTQPPAILTNRRAIAQAVACTVCGAAWHAAQKSGAGAQKRPAAGRGPSLRRGARKRQSGPDTAAFAGATPTNACWGLAHIRVECVCMHSRRAPTRPWVAQCRGRTRTAARRRALSGTGRARTGRAGRCDGAKRQGGRR
jgi:hypothetical protein